MKDFKGIPGPYHVVEHSWSATGIYNAERLVCMLELENSFNVNEDNQGELQAVALATARLLAAAPDLLAALRAWASAERYAAAYGHIPEVQEQVAEAWDQAVDLRDAALAKVFGE